MSKKKLPLFFDGAFGTYYLSRTSDEAPCEFANLNHPECVRAIHKEYIAAGCDAIKRIRSVRIICCAMTRI